MTHEHEKQTALQRALAHQSPSARLRAALHAGSVPDDCSIGALIERCRLEPDFYVRDMLTWALTRHRTAGTVPALLADVDDEVARSAWRAAVVLVPTDENQRGRLAETLATQLGRGGPEMHRSLSRAFVALGEHGEAALHRAERSIDPAVRAHAIATARLVADPDSGFGPHLDDARRRMALGPE